MPAPRAQRDGSYLVDDEGLPAGSTLGGPDLCVTLKGNGTIERVYSLAARAPLVSGLAIRHWELELGLHLQRRAGTYELRPESQIHRYRLGDHVEVEETTFVLDDGESRADACYVLARIRNAGCSRLHLGSVVFARIATTMTGADVEACYDEALRALLVWNRHDGAHARAVVVSGAPASWAVTTDHARAVEDQWHGPFPRTIDAAGCDPLGVLHLDHRLEAGEDARYDVRVVALPHGVETAPDVLAALPGADAALEATRARYHRFLQRSVVLTPVREVDLGVHWAKANMLRVMRRTPTGPGFTNDPGNSSACVGRDASWFVHGCDWMEPSFSRALLRGFAARAEDDGKIVEWYDLRTAQTHDDGLNVNDDTALFVLGVWHSVVASGDRALLAELYPPAARAGEQLLRHRDARGLVWSSASGTGARGIVGWRNIIDGYRISGATTELNCETYAALTKLAELARALGRDDEAARWKREADALHGAIERHLRNPENGLYYLCIDVDGRPRSEVSSDLVFPVMFGVSDDATSARIVTRLRERDFWTAAGIRTVPRDAPEYGPTHGDGLLGGVWVAVTFWYAFAAASFVPEIMGEALIASFSHYARDPQATNTVPGQFSEWLHGETLANRGMLLSPWFAPRYVWAAVEGACGLQPRIDRPGIAPNIPPSWTWIAVRNVPLHGESLTCIAVRGEGLRILATRKLECAHAFELFERDVTDDVRVVGGEAGIVALRARDRVVVFLGNREDHSVTVALPRKGALAGHRAVRRYDGLRTTWIEIPEGENDPSVVVTLASRGFVLVEFRT